MDDAADEMLARLNVVERDVLIHAVTIRVPTTCAQSPRMFDHQRQGESNVTFENRANAAVSLCADCPVLAQCDLKARLLGITGVVGGRYRPVRTTRAGPCDLDTASPDPAQTAALIAAAQSSACLSGRWRTLAPSR